MPDPINDPVPEEDTIHASQPPPRPGIPKSKKAEQQRRWDRKHRREMRQLQAVLATEDGEAVIMMILARCNMYYTGKMDDFMQGRRILGALLIEQIMLLGPEAYPSMLTNHGKRRLMWAVEDDLAEKNNAENA